MWGRIMRLLRREEVSQKVGLSRSAIYERMAKGIFPKPVVLGPKSVAWPEPEVEQWIADRIAARDGNGKKGGE